MPGGKDQVSNPNFGNMDGDGEEGGDDDDDFEEEEWVPDVFMFEYGTVVIWGMTEREEKAFLKSLYVLPFSSVFLSLGERVLTLVSKEKVRGGTTGSGRCGDGRFEFLLCGLFAVSSTGP